MQLRNASFAIDFILFRPCISVLTVVIRMHYSMIEVQRPADVPSEVFSEAHLTQAEILT